MYECCKNCAHSTESRFPTKYEKYWCFQLKRNVEEISICKFWDEKESDEDHINWNIESRFG